MIIVVWALEQVEGKNSETHHLHITQLPLSQIQFHSKSQKKLSQLIHWGMAIGDWEGTFLCFLRVKPLVTIKHYLGLILAPILSSFVLIYSQSTQSFLETCMTLKFRCLCQDFSSSLALQKLNPQKPIFFLLNLEIPQLGFPKTMKASKFEDARARQ